MKHLLFKPIFYCLNFSWRVIRKLVLIVREYFINFKIHNLSHGTRGRITLKNPFISINIKIASSAQFILHGELSLGSLDLEYSNPISIVLGENSILKIDGDFEIGPGSRLILYPGAMLSIGGKEKESSSGFTESALVLVHSNLTIGKDLICAWRCFITDCDWHPIDGRPYQMNTHIGDHVWIAGNCSILKGSIINNGCIVSTGSVVHKINIPANSICGGSPLQVLAREITWHRDLPNREFS